jgi:multidrug efflux pump subunit AcrA (membrane-fusion protein)
MNPLRARIAIPLAGVLTLSGWLALRACSSASRTGSTPDWTPVVEGPFEVWSSYEGELAARNVQVLSSRFNGPATLTFIAPEGARVRKGDPVARFDGFQAGQDLVRFERELAVAEADARTIELAVLPLEIREMQTALLEARVGLSAEEQFLADSAGLLADGLISEQENESQRLKVEGLKSRVAQLEMKQRLTLEHVHPARLNEARAKLDAARRQRDSMREQLEHCVLEAPADGEVVHLALPIGSEMRTARVGDVLYRNQEFLCIPDASGWIVRCHVPEHELSRVRPGLPAHIIPRAYPGTTIPGEVETVSAMAQARPLAPGQRSFSVTLRVRDVPDTMKSGLTVQVRLLSRQSAKALRVPRSAVRWGPAGAFCRVRDGRGASDRPVQVGFGNESEYEVLSGLKPGDWVQP